MMIQDLRLKNVLLNISLLLHQYATTKSSLIYFRTLKEIYNLEEFLRTTIDKKLVI